MEQARPSGKKLLLIGALEAVGKLSCLFVFSFLPSFLFHFFIFCFVKFKYYAMGNLPCPLGLAIIFHSILPMGLEYSNKEWQNLQEFRSFLERCIIISVPRDKDLLDPEGSQVLRVKDTVEWDRRLKTILQIEGFLFLQDPEVTRGCEVGRQGIRKQELLQF